MPDKIPTLAVLQTRRFFDPIVAPHILTFISIAKDFPYMKDVLSDYMIGVILFAVTTGIIRPFEGRLFQIPTVDAGGAGIPLPPGITKRGPLSIRVGLPHAGQPFLDPDGLPLTFHGFLFIGAAGFGLSHDQLDLIPRSPYTFHNLHTHPNYAQWVSTHLWGGGPPNTPSTVAHQNQDNSDERHKNCNRRPYVPGPLSGPLPVGYADVFPYKRPRGVRFVAVRELQMPSVGPLLPLNGLPPSQPAAHPNPEDNVAVPSSSISSEDSRISSEKAGPKSGEDVIAVLSSSSSSEDSGISSDKTGPEGGENVVTVPENDRNEEHNIGNSPNSKPSTQDHQRLRRVYKYRKGPAKRRVYRVEF